MRIAVVFDCLFPWSTGGGERQYRLFAESFREQGWDVDYLTRRQWDGPPPDLDGVRVVPVSGPSELYDAQGARRPWPALVFAFAVFRHMVRTRGRYDAVLVSALPVLNVFAVRLALLGTRTRICADFLEVWRRDQWLAYSGPVLGRVAAWLQRRAVRASPLVSAHSQMNGRRLVAEGARRPPVVSPGLIHGAATADVSLAAAEPPTVVYVGRHIPDKQVETIPAAVEVARRHVPDLRAVILGDGQQRPAVLAEVRRLGLTDVVELPGFVEQDVLEAAVRDAAVLVNPSRREGYGLVVVEACAVGTPVVLVAGDDNASVELVQEGVNGFVADSASAESLGAALVAAVRGGPALRAGARAWFEHAARERTADAAARGILAALTRS
ncbi:glycosyltransferase family 4 protein [Cellulomonas fengjieae]|uniref:Glycosyltransferase family 4 protein n=1 Tax=Cellulomonas fengjieae TaxID=2819978 RepID=A0ABS3SDN5_9CELL|nr:glycosyltransferase family 4 protein [Cellulomonas fengjieae]MBO3083850.1 glycosyltransferase family 4 protein [Cellulomonas fengjieae]QVI64864.1 glycosyltransferase family 4 protein [Cellulomonas fengjieae]